mgnify:CR=1 FL=1
MSICRNVGWNTIARGDGLAGFLRTTRNARLDIIVHDTRRIETSAPRRLRCSAVTDTR